LFFRGANVVAVFRIPKKYFQKKENRCSSDVFTLCKPYKFLLLSLDFKSTNLKFVTSLNLKK